MQGYIVEIGLESWKSVQGASWLHQFRELPSCTSKGDIYEMQGYIVETNQCKELPGCISSRTFLVASVQGAAQIWGFLLNPRLYRGNRAWKLGISARRFLVASVQRVSRLHQFKELHKYGGFILNAKLYRGNGAWKMKISARNFLVASVQGAAYLHKGYFY